MAGGMGIGRGVPLRDRPLGTPGIRLRAAPTRHCWVQGPKEHPGPWPGVVVQWRQEPGARGWSALVVYVVLDGPDPATVQAWVSSAFLTPANEH